MTMCAEGDVGGIIELLGNIAAGGDDDGEEEEEEEKGAEKQDEEEMSAAQILRYQDPLDGNKSSLHLALEKGQSETVFLLLWLASKVPDEDFPEQVVHAALSMGAGRELVDGGVDIRDLRDEMGRAPGDVAVEIGGQWQNLVMAGLLKSS